MYGKPQNSENSGSVWIGVNSTSEFTLPLANKRSMVLMIWQFLEHPVNTRHNTTVVIATHSSHQYGC